MGSDLRLWRLPAQPVPCKTIHVTTAGKDGGRRRDGITLHRTIELPPNHVRRVQSLPLTSPERTLLDCGPLLEPRQLERALDEALARHLTSFTKLRELLANTHPQRPGHPQLRVLVTDRQRPTVTKAEERLFQLIRAAGLPEPHTQVMLYEQSVDAYWPDARFAVDSIMWHTNKTKFMTDRRKEQILRDHGITLSRTTWHQITHHPLHTHHPLQLAAHIGLQIGLGTALATHQGPSGQADVLKVS